MRGESKLWYWPEIDYGSPVFLDKIALVNNKEPDWDFSLISDCVCPVCHFVCMGGGGMFLSLNIFFICDTILSYCHKVADWCSG